MTPENWYKMIYSCALSDNPDDRYIAACTDEFAELLSHDESWLVRHGSKRSIQRQAEEKCGNFHRSRPEDFPFTGIADIVYELYKEDWMHANTTHESRVQKIFDWAEYQLDAILRGGPDFGSYSNFRFEDMYEGELYMPYDFFVGQYQPGQVGLYHNQEYVRSLLGNHQELIKAYLEDIKDFSKGNLVVDELLDMATCHSEQTDSHAKPVTKDSREL